MEVEKVSVDKVSLDAVTTSFKVSPSFAVVASMASNERQRFTVELRPDETTIVSWKKLVKESSKLNPVPLAVEPPTGAHPALEARIAPGGQTAECEPKDAPPSRFSSVIEKIERLYVGNRSSDDEELADVPDDDQYDTDDSFIDDADLDEYFEVDKSTTKHNGFFINRGTLECALLYFLFLLSPYARNEPTSSPNHQPKKRRRKDSTTRSEKGDEIVTNKHDKVGNVKMKAAARTATLAGNKSSGSSPSLATQGEQYQDTKSKNQLVAPMEPPRKKSSEPNIKHEQSSLNINAIIGKHSENTEKQKAGAIQSRDSGMKLNVANESSDATHQIYRDKGVSVELESLSRKRLSDKEMEYSTKFRHKERNGSSELPDIIFSNTKYVAQNSKISPTMPVKGGSSVRPKGTMLERAIRELESIVAEPRPPTMELKDADNSSQAVKRRLPRDVKHKLAKVARIASSQGKISEDLIRRLMGILGHIVNLRTLKRNLKEMVEVGLSVKKEKDTMLQQIKQEVVEMVKARLPSLKAKVSDKRDGASDDFQEVYGSEENGDSKGKYSMDKAMEDKICDLYDRYVEGMDEDKGPLIRKLYVESGKTVLVRKIHELVERFEFFSIEHVFREANGAADHLSTLANEDGYFEITPDEFDEVFNRIVKENAEGRLAELWPTGTMDNRGIKEAVCRSKARKRALYSRQKNPEKSEKTKLTKSPSSTTRTDENIVRGDASSIVQPHRPVQEKAVVTADLGSRTLTTSPHRVSSEVPSLNHRPPAAQGRMSLSHSSMNGSGDKTKVGRSNAGILDEATRKSTDHTLLTKKLKRKSETDLGDTTHNKERIKSHKQAGSYPHKSTSIQLPAAPGCEQFS
ncbi:hypothetical protein GIB67_001531 [Kingdonia uniflora]|uniref:Hpc2-related domain-containing protein n=1 Tax=Kingdonia uniflora TaxID=39325 RepID=A0A7J7LZ76_9MAGN|nr:hypothetical protein GIB67_001531 [Kingdonia uniflora]